MPKKTKPKVNKSSFVRSQPLTAPAKVVVAKAKAAGVVITEGLVYAVRAADRAKVGKAKKGKPGRPAGKTAKVIGGSELEQAIRKLAWAHGFWALEEAVERIKSQAGV
jgi:hypothetical protein